MSESNGGQKISLPNQLLLGVIGLLFTTFGLLYNNAIQRIEKLETKIDNLEKQDQRHTDEENHHAFTINEHTKAIQFLERTKQDKRKSTDE